MNLTAMKINKRLIYIKGIRKLLDEVGKSFTHKTSKRRDIIRYIQKNVDLLEREIKRDIKPDA